MLDKKRIILVKILVKKSFTYYLVDYLKCKTNRQLVDNRFGRSLQIELYYIRPLGQ